MNIKIIIYILSRFMLICALLLIIPLLVTVIYGENLILAFLVPIIGMLVPGILMGLRKPQNTTVYAKEGFVIVALCWILLAFFGAMPYYLSGTNLSFLDSLFETVSGLTTTGASILTNVEVMPKGILFWRSFTNWIGGMGVLVFMLAILPQKESNYVFLAKAEVPGPQFGKLVSKLKFTMRILYSIYAILTLLLMLFLIFGGMPVFDSIVNSFATAGTGGFAIRNASIGSYNSAYIEYVIGIFMLLFGVNFTLFYLLLTKHFMQVLKSEELRYYFSIVGCSVILIAINISSLFENFSESIRHAFFQVSSIITTTGYSSTDFNLWPGFSKALLVVLMFSGACAGSTAGGLKISRVIVLFKSAVREIKHAISPRSVRSIKFENQALDNEIVSSVKAYFVILMFFTGVSFIIVSLDNIDVTSAFTSVAACINNIGPGLEIVGPAGNFSSLSALSKSVLIFDMLAGRLEFFPILMLFSPSVWKGR